MNTETNNEPIFDSEETNDEAIQLFDDDAKNINDGDKFVAKVRSVEGRKVVELVKI